MKAYKYFYNKNVKEYALFIKGKEYCYLLWDIFQNINLKYFLVIDQFKISKEKISYISCIYCYHENPPEWTYLDDLRLTEWIMKVEQCPQVQLEQYLTHPNELARKYIRMLVNGDLPL